jgi:hypothetical protein
MPELEAAADAHDDSGSRLLKAVQSIAIHPKDARALVDNYFAQSRVANPSADAKRHQELVAEKVISRYCRLAATTGGVTALAGVVPGLGTVAAMLGGGLTDAAVTMKLQVDMTMCLAHTFGWDLDTEDARHLVFLIAAGGTLEKAGVEAATRVASKAGVTMLRQYLKGAALMAVKQFFKRLGIIFTRKALERAIPFGVGVVIGSSANYALTKYVGDAAKRWFVIDRDNDQQSTT